MKTVGAATTLYWPLVNGFKNESLGTGASMGSQVFFDGKMVWHSFGGSYLVTFTDHLGSPRITGEAGGVLLDDIDYQTFGTEFNNYGSSPSNNHYLYAGYESDSETTSDYATFRNLGTTMGRFNRPDPYDGSYDSSNPQSLNRYSYVMNNPLRMRDPLGLDNDSDDDTDDVDANSDEEAGGGGGEPVNIECNDGGCTASTVSVTVSGTPDPAPPPTPIPPDGCDLPGSCDNPPVGSPSFPSLGGTGGAGGGGAPRSGYESLFCLGDALQSNGLSLVLDAVGLIPAGGSVSAAFSLFHGAAGVSNGLNILSRVQMGVGLIGTASAANEVQNGGGDLEQAQLFTGIASIGVALGKVAPIYGQVLSGISLGIDAAKTYKAQSACVDSGKYN